MCPNKPLLIRRWNGRLCKTYVDDCLCSRPTQATPATQRPCVRYAWRTKMPRDLDLWRMTLKFSGFERLSKYMFVQNFIKLSAAVHELSCVQRKKLRRKQYSPSLGRGQWNEWMSTQWIAEDATSERAAETSFIACTRHAKPLSTDNRIIYLLFLYSRLSRLHVDSGTLDMVLEDGNGQNDPPSGQNPPITHVCLTYCMRRMCIYSGQEIWASSHETRDSISLISYADWLGLSPVYLSENSS